MIAKRGSGWVVLDREGYVVSRHRTKGAAEGASGGAYYVRRNRRRAKTVREVVYVETPRRRRRQNPWTVEDND